MKSVKAMILLVCFVGLSTPTQAQFWKKITKKIQKNAEDKVLNKIDKTTDKKMDDVLDGTKKSKTITTTSVNKGKKLPKNYTFNTSITIEMTTNQKEKANFQYFFNNSYKDRVCFKVDPAKMGANTGGASGEMYMVIDNNSSTLFMNMMGMKIKKTMSKDQTSQFDNSQNIEDANIVKTGKTKTILGFQCYEYKVTLKDNNDIVTHLWTTTNFPVKSTFIPMLGMKNDNTKIKGFVLEFESKTPNGSNSIKVTNINYNAQLTIQTTDYKSMRF